MSLGQIEAASCGATKPEKAPDLFQIDATKTSAKLYFTPVNNAITNYTILYGLERGRNDFGVSFPFGKYDGVINYTINALSPNTKYYFRVRADNGCRVGWSSDTMSITTNEDFKKYTKFKDNDSVKNITQTPKTSIAFKVPAKTQEPTIILGKTKIKTLSTKPGIQVAKKSKKETNKKMNIVSLFQFISEKIASLGI